VLTAIWTWFIYQDTCNIYSWWKRGDRYRSWKGVPYRRGVVSRTNNSSNTDRSQCKLYAHFLSHISRIAFPYISVSLWNKNMTLGNGFWAVFKERNFFVTHCMCSATCNGMCHPSINHNSFIFVGMKCVLSHWGNNVFWGTLRKKIVRRKSDPLRELIIEGLRKIYNEVCYWNCS